MTDDKDLRADQQELEEEQREDRTLTRRITRYDVSDAEAKTPDGSNYKQASPSGGVFQQMWRRIQEERKRLKPVEPSTRGQNNMDRSKAFLVLATAVVLVGFVFLALFSTSGAEKRAQERRTKPSLGRPESTVQQAGATGSTVPLLSADQNGADSNGDQLSPDDILATSRRTQAAPPKQEQPDGKDPNQYALSNLPPVNDPALDAYRHQNYSYTPPPAPAPPPTPVPAKETPTDSDAWKKSSLVFVRNTTTAAVVNAGVSSARTQQAFIERKGTSTLLPAGSRLVADHRPVSPSVELQRAEIGDAAGAERTQACCRAIASRQFKHARSAVDAAGDVPQARAAATAGSRVGLLRGEPQDAQAQRHALGGLTLRVAAQVLLVFGLGVRELSGTLVSQAEQLLNVRALAEFLEGLPS